MTKSQTETGLKYLWHVLYYDGTIVHQRPEDVSERDPTKSQYYDIEVGNIYQFWLTPATGTHPSYLLDLNDGHFEVNGMPFRMHEDNGLKSLMQLSSILGRVPQEEDGRLTLVWRRRNRHRAQLSASVGTDGKVKETLTPLDHRVIYRLGWTVKQDGRTIERIMEID